MHNFPYAVLNKNLALTPALINQTKLPTLPSLTFQQQSIYLPISCFWSANEGEINP